MVYTTLCSTFGGNKTRKYLYMCILFVVTYNYYLKLVSTLAWVQYKNTIAVLCANYCIFSNNTTLRTTKDIIQQVLSRCKTTKNITRQII